MNKTIGVIGAMDVEIETLRARLENRTDERVSGVLFSRGKLEGQDVVLAVCGMGKCFASLCAEAMILRYSPSLIINVGVAGTLTNELGIGDIAVGTDAVCHDMDTSPLGDPVGMISGINMVHFPLSGEAADRFFAVCKKKNVRAVKGTIASGDKFLVDRKEKNAIKDAFGAIACEMEGQPIAQVCYVNAVPCVILRSISDSIDGGASDYESFKRAAAEVSSSVVRAFLAEYRE